MSKNNIILLGVAIVLILTSIWTLGGIFEGEYIEKRKKDTVMRGETMVITHKNN